jgi:tetratricopeptide (TPR) repeat protein
MQQENWRFEQPPNCAVVTTKDIAYGVAPILHAIRDLNQDEWTFLSSPTCKEEDTILVSLSRIVTADPTVLDIADLPSGWTATRICKKAPWVRSAIVNPSNATTKGSNLNLKDRRVLDAAEGWHMMLNYENAAQEVASIDPSAINDPDVLKLRARAYWGLRQIPEAMACIDKLIELDPDKPGPYVFKAQLLSYDDKPNAAFNLLKSVIARFPDHASMHYDIAVYAGEIGNWPEALYWSQITISMSHFKHLLLNNQALAPIHDQIRKMGPPAH